MSYDGKSKSSPQLSTHHSLATSNSEDMSYSEGMSSLDSRSDTQESKLDLMFLAVQSESLTEQHQILETYDTRWSLLEGGSHCELKFANSFPTYTTYSCTVSDCGEALTPDYVIALEEAMMTETDKVLIVVRRMILVNQTVGLGPRDALWTFRLILNHPQHPKSDSKPSASLIRMMPERPNGDCDHFVAF